MTRPGGELSYDGIWSVQVASDFGWQTLGILVLDNGRALGGSDRGYSRGTYEVDRAKLRMSLHVDFYRPPRTLFGVAENHIELHVEGERLQDTVTGQAERRDVPGLSLPIRLTWRARLVDAP